MFTISIRCRGDGDGVSSLFTWKDVVTDSVLTLRINGVGSAWP